jgi:putative ABC transport system permease protein
MAQSSKDAGFLTMEVVQGDYAGVQRMRPIAGQLAGLSNDGPQAGQRVIIGERLWRTWFNASRSIMGRETLRIRGASFTIGGVVPTAHSYRGTELWMSEDSWRVTAPRARHPWDDGLIRFRPGSERNRLLPMIDLALAEGPTPPGEGFDTVMTGISAPFVRSSAMTWVVMSLSLLVLLAACANLANMLQARAAQRMGEIAVRLSLGASISNVFRLFLFETGIIAGLAAILGGASAFVALRHVADILPGDVFDRLRTFPSDVSPDWRLLFYAVSASLVAAIVVGGFTAWRGSRAPVLRLLGSAGIGLTKESRGRWTRTALVAVQVSAALILLLGTGLYLVRAFRDTTSTITFDTSRLATAQLMVGTEEFNDTEASGLLPQLVSAMEHLDGVEAAAITDGMFGGTYKQPRPMMNLVAEDLNEPEQVSRFRVVTGIQAAVSPGFLDTLGLKLLTGRNFQAIDVDGAPEVALLSASAAQTLWPGLDPLGRKVKIGPADKRWFTVIGTFEDPMKPEVPQSRTSSSNVALVSYAQVKFRNWLVVLRSTAPGAASQRVRPAVDAINANVFVYNASIADQSMFAAAHVDTVLNGIVGSLGFLALAIAALGVYGVISYSVSRRTREFGIRLALGATPSRIVRSVVDDAIHLVLVGLLPGVLLASWSTRLLEARIVNLMPNDIPTWAVVPTLILAIGVFAAWIPARRASRVDPNVALRNL